MKKNTYETPTIKSYSNETILEKLGPATAVYP